MYIHLYSDWVEMKGTVWLAGSVMGSGSSERMMRFSATRA